MTEAAPRLVRRKLGTVLMALGAYLGALMFFAPGAGAASDAFNVSGTVSFNSAANHTTTHFIFSGNKVPSDIRVLPCSSASVLDATGPTGTKSSSTGFGGSGQTGVKFQPGAFGNYTVVFSGHIFRVDVVIVSGHQHTVFGLGNATCAPATIPPSTTTTEAPTTTTTARPAIAPAGSGTSGAPIVGGSNANPGVGFARIAEGRAVVAGTQVQRSAPAGPVEPAVAGTALARTGRHTRLMLVLAGFALCLGGFALMAGEPRRALAPIRVTPTR